MRRPLAAELRGAARPPGHALRPPGHALRPLCARRPSPGFGTRLRPPRGAAGIELDAAAVDAALQLLEPFRDEAADTARAACGALESADSKATGVLAELEPVEKLRADFGEAQEWHALHSQCYTADKEGGGSFAYSLCPFGAFTQDGRKLGDYAGWAVMGEEALDAARRVGHEPYARYMRFEKGEDCDGTPRKAAVHFECGEEDQLLEVTEPSTVRRPLEPTFEPGAPCLSRPRPRPDGRLASTRARAPRPSRQCVYSAWFSSPSACSVDALRQKHEALALAAAGAGLPYVPSDELRSLLGL